MLQMKQEKFVSFVQNCGLVNFSVDKWILEVTSPLDRWLKILNETPVFYIPCFGFE